MSDDIVSKENASLPFIVDILRAGYLNVEKVNTNYFAADMDGLKVAVVLDENKRWIWFRSSFDLSGKTTHQQNLEFVNDLNGKLIFMRAEIDVIDGSDTLVLDYFLWIEGGVTKRNIYLTIQEFARVVRDVPAIDTKGVLS
jgi:hypothetical protein